MSKQEKKTKKNKKHPVLSIFLNKKVLKFFLKWGFIFGVWFSIFIVILLMYYSKDLPDINPIINTNETSMELLYSNNNELYRYGNLNTNIENYAEFPLYLVDCLLATEDRKFFKHHGFDYFAILRAMFVNLRYGSIKQGGSTITQQLSKMILKNTKKTMKRKLQELILAFQLEKKLSKEEIITMYLNKAYFGAGKYGIKDASKFYFNKTVSQLDLEESAMLIGLLKAPSKYSPKNNPVLSKQRTKQIITNMYDAKLLSKEEYNNYLNTYFDSIVDATTNSNIFLNQKMYFADWIKSQIKDYTTHENIEIQTTLNEYIQDILESNIANFVKQYSDKLKDSQIAVVVMANDGAVLGMTGGIDYNKSEFNRALYAFRQPGSAFKLFVFLAGIREQNYNPDSLFIDEPIAVGNWFPDNYGEKYYGEVDMKTAFAKYLNSVAIQISEYSGIKNVAKMAKKMGISSYIDGGDPTIALGTPQVNLLELTSAFAVIANNGKGVIPYSITKIKDKDTNNIIYKRKTTGLPYILNEYEVDYMREMMHEVIRTGTGKNARIQSLINLGNCCIGGKTGTSQNYSDAWFIGYANDIVIGVWIGKDNNKSMGRTTGGTLPSLLWRSIVVDLIK